MNNTLDISGAFIEITSVRLPEGISSKTGHYGRGIRRGIGSAADREGYGSRGTVCCCVQVGGDGGGGGVRKSTEASINSVDKAEGLSNNAKPAYATRNYVMI